MAQITLAHPPETTYQKMLPWVLITELYWLTYKLLERRLYSLGVSVSQSRVMTVLYYSTEPVKPSSIATLLFQETQSITGILHRIETRGWVRRLPDPNDRRAIGLELTDAGRELTDKVIDMSEVLYDEVFGVLTAAERRSVENALRKLRSHGFRLPEIDWKLRRAQQHPMWSA